MPVTLPQNRMVNLSMSRLVGANICYGCAPKMMPVSSQLNMSYGREPPYKTLGIAYRARSAEASLASPPSPHLHLVFNPLRRTKLRTQPLEPLKPCTSISSAFFRAFSMRQAYVNVPGLRTHPWHQCTIYFSKSYKLVTVQLALVGGRTHCRHIGKMRRGPSTQLR